MARRERGNQTNGRRGADTCREFKFKMWYQVDRCPRFNSRGMDTEYITKYLDRTMNSEQRAEGSGLARSTALGHTRSQK